VYRKSARTYIKKARRYIEAGAWDDATLTVRQAVKALDKAAQKGIIHKNNAARRKSRLMRQLYRARAATSE
jgi:small subunit ribosomal protein S20